MRRSGLRTAIVVTAAASAGLAPGVAASGTAPLRTQSSSGQDRLPTQTADRIQREVAARVVGLDTNAVSAFLRADRANQSRALSSAGLRDPGGSLDDRHVQLYLLGSWQHQYGSPAEGAKLMLASGLASVDESRTLASELSIADFAPAAAEVSDTMAARAVDEPAAAERARLQSLATHLRPLLTKTVPGILGLWIADSGDHLILASQNPTAAGAEVKRLGFQREILPQRSNMSEKALVDIMDVADALLDKAPGGDSRSVTVDKIGERVVVKLAIGDPARDVISTNPRASAWIRDGLLDLDIVPPDQLSMPALTMQGGGSTGSGCTWGFSAKTSSDPDKLITAAHCVDSPQYFGFVSLPFNKQCQGSMYPGCGNSQSDAQMHDVQQPTHTADNSIHIDTGNRDITSVTSWEAMDINDTVCHQGITTGESCGSITSRFVSEGLAPGSNQFVEVTGSTSESKPGDSGGPYFYGNSAYGLLSTSNANNPPNNLANFGAISFAEQSLGMSVKTK